MAKNLRFLNILLTICLGFTLLVFSAGNEATAIEIPGHVTPVNAISISSDSQMIASGGEDGSIRIWDLRTFEYLGSISEGSAGVKAIDFSPDGRTLASGYADGSIVLWAVNTGEATHRIKAHLDSVLEVAYDPDGNGLVSASSTGKVKGWTLSGSPKGTPLFLGKAASAFAREPGGWGGVIGSDKEIRFFDQERRLVETIREGLDGSTALAVAPGSKSFAFGSQNTIRLWNLENGSEDAILKGHIFEIRALDFHPERQCIASGSVDKTVRMWNLKTGKRERNFIGHFLTVTDVAFTPDGSRLASASADHTVKIWDVTTGRCLATLGTPLSRSRDMWGVTIHTAEKSGRMVDATFPMEYWDTKPGYSFYFIGLKITNMLDVENSFFSTNIFLRDGKGRIFLCVGEREIGLLENAVEEMEFLKYRASGNQSKTLDFVFLVPINAQDLKLQFMDLDPMALGSYLH